MGNFFQGDNFLLQTKRHNFSREKQRYARKTFAKKIRRNQNFEHFGKHLKKFLRGDSQYDSCGK